MVQRYILSGEVLLRRDDGGINPSIEGT